MIIGLVIMFIVVMVMLINMGVVVFVLVFIIGGLWVDMGGKEVLVGFFGDLFLILVGIIYLFVIVQKNGIIDLLVYWVVKVVCGYIVVILWVMFVIIVVFIVFGVLGLVVVVIIGLVVLCFVKQYNINLLMMGLLVIYGVQVGGFLLISVYGSIINGVVQKVGLEVIEMVVFLISLGFNFMMVMICFFVFGGIVLLCCGLIIVVGMIGNVELVMVGGLQVLLCQFVIEGYGVLVVVGGGMFSNDLVVLDVVGLICEWLFILIGLFGLGVVVLIYNFNVGLVLIIVVVVLVLLLL